jgi:hypothetical protein
LFTHKNDDVPEATPFEEKDLGMHFHRWYHHYYCREPVYRDGKVDIVNSPAFDKSNERIDNKQ